MMKLFNERKTSAGGLSLIEILIAIGILGVTMSLIGAAFPAGVMMSIAVSDETTAQTVFQMALAEIKEKLSISDNSSLGTTLTNMPSGLFSDESRKLAENSPFSWSALVRRMADGANPGPMGNLCQVVVVVSRRPSGNASFMPNLQSVTCTGSDTTARTLDIVSNMVPNNGYIIDATTGAAYAVISREDNTVVTFSTPPSITSAREFWVVPGPNNGPQSPAIRVFQAMLYLP